MAQEAADHVLSLLLARRSLPQENLFHYTSPAGFLGIVQSGELWATDFEYLNDSLEGAVADHILRDQLHTQIASADDDVSARCLKAMLKVHDNHPIARTYVASLSEPGDLLSQWRQYSPSTGGFALGIPVQTLTEIPGCALIPCIYDDHEKLCTSVIAYLIDNHCTAGIPHLHSQFVSARRLLIAAIKHGSFAAELEWRLVSARGERVQDFREGRGGLVPYVRLPLVADSSQELKLSRVYVGPHLHPFLALQAARDVLKTGKLTCRGNGVKLADTSHRSW